jgi:hypothetical protein
LILLDCLDDGGDDSAGLLLQARGRGVAPDEPLTGLGRADFEPKAAGGNPVELRNVRPGAEPLGPPSSAVSTCGTWSYSSKMSSDRRAPPTLTNGLGLFVGTLTPMRHFRFAPASSIARSRPSTRGIDSGATCRLAGFCSRAL